MPAYAIFATCKTGPTLCLKGKKKKIIFSVSDMFVMHVKAREERMNATLHSA